MGADLALITELEDALKNGPPEKRAAILRRVTSLFLNGADRLNEQQVAVFDDVLVHLTQRIESRTLVELSTTLAPIANAPVAMVRRLANDDKIIVAGPVLSQSSRLTDDDLIDVVKSKGQAHLLAISGRATLTETVTDVLLERGDQQVTHTLAENAGATFSELGFASIIKKSEQDRSLVEKLAFRLDIPPQLLRELLSRATDLVRSRLLSSATPEKREQIQRALENIANEVGREAAGPRDFTASESLVQQLNRNGKLNERVFLDFIKERNYENMTSALALFCGAPVTLVERLMKNIEPDGLLIACKTAKLGWPTVRELLKVRFIHHSVSEQALDEAKSSFVTLTLATAQRTLRFILVQEKSKAAV